MDDKPYLEAPSSDGKTDEELAAISWDNYQKRNASIIADIFAGQFR